VQRLEESVGAKEAQRKADSASVNASALADEQKQLQQARADYEQLKASLASKPD